MLLNDALFCSIFIFTKGIEKELPMTDNFLQRLEEKVMVLLTELESLRKELNHLRHENANLKTEKANHSKKLQSLVSLLDSLEAESANYSSELRVVGAEEEFATA